MLSSSTSSDNPSPCKIPGPPATTSTTTENDIPTSESRPSSILNPTLTAAHPSIQHRFAHTLAHGHTMPQPFPRWPKSYVHFRAKGEVAADHLSPQTRVEFQSRRDNIFQERKFAMTRDGFLGMRAAADGRGRCRRFRSCERRRRLSFGDGREDGTSLTFFASGFMFTGS
ncbi:uncharacterized protein K489DRAFT_93638 [Dissoconium aciculare CBS 342.82]|uniref:Uncharacterized protein n=1 Tax=Dissoconium aciculare CBS 342.82 TaxID=1314786 RepID=A0A6J3LUW7_9PEZI|nr:uncharacterized protein K489DRAFT_93638 [Dissoconium aciculare CBS 342.82]KAF1818417.1 hypothetical protein K489DRAFT_93638 [Dissoconium aciculare CBS 342.82]